MLWGEASCVHEQIYGGARVVWIWSVRPETLGKRSPKQVKSSEIAAPANISTADLGETMSYNCTDKLLIGSWIGENM